MITMDTDKDDVRVKGDDGTPEGKLIGVIGDCLKTYDCKNFRYEDLGPSVGGIARGTSVGTAWQTIYSVSGKGIFAGFLVTVQNPNEQWFVRLSIDGLEYLNATTGISFEDCNDDQVYGFLFDDNRPNTGLGIDCFKNTIRFDMNAHYTSSIVIRLRKADGNKVFRAGLASRSIV